MGLDNIYGIHLLLFPKKIANEYDWLIGVFFSFSKIKFFLRGQSCPFCCPYNLKDLDHGFRTR